MRPKELILIVEDDPAISKMLSFSLTQEGYKCVVAEDMHHALRHLQVYKPDIILLDLSLPDGDGKNLIKTVRSESLTPIIVVSARNDEKEIVTSLDMGSDDYVTKPFSTHELLARIRSAQRRSLGLTRSSERITCNAITLDLQRHSIYKDQTLLRLTPTEFNLLKYCILHPNQVLTHARLLKEVWGVGYQLEMQYLRTFINSLRKKIEDVPARPKYIVTEMGIGYRFCCNDDIDSKE
ncbi:MAG: response regulator transcription factor [Campylobacterales bacterium]|nr:response regulator transcription factor [Campylobacterales bacterium]